MSESPLMGPVPSDSLLAWSEALAAGTPTPGGGSAAAIATAMAAGLAGMVARLAASKNAPEAKQLHAVAAEADELRGVALRLAEADWRAVSAVFEVLKQPNTSTEERELRKSALQTAWAGAARVPLELVRVAARVATLSRHAADGGHRNSWGDAAVAVQLAATAAQSAALMLDLDLAGPSDSESAVMIADAKRLAAEAEAEAERVVKTMRAVSSNR